MKKQITFLLSTLLLVSPALLVAQDLNVNDQLGDLLGQGSGSGTGEPEFSYTLQANTLEASAPVVLTVSVALPEDRHTYSMTDENSPTSVKMHDVVGLEPVGEFTANKEPKVVVDQEIGFTYEKFYDTVTWTRHYRITDPAGPKMTGKVSGTVCNDEGCLPYDDTFALNVEVTNDKLPDPPTPTKAKGEIRPYALELTPKRRDQPEPTKFQFSLTPEDATAGDEVTLSIRMDLESHWHTFGQAMDDLGGQPTTINVSAKNLTEVDSEFTPDPEPHNKTVDLGGGLTSDQILIEDHVVWTKKYKVSDGVAKGDYGVDGDVKYQICQDTTCKLPLSVKFGLGLTGASESAAAGKSGSKADKPKPAIAHVVNNDSPEQIAEMAKLYDVETPIKFSQLGVTEKVKTTLLTAIFGAFVGGMLLNLMPCVFPVLGIKVMGFVQLAGDDAGKIRKHGIAFTMGLVVSMWCLAGAILFLKLSLGKSVNWGEQMGNSYFVAGIIILLFVLGLNMAGVFEMGTSLTRVGGGLHKKKGYGQSFFSGILTTLIATPCSGPFLGAAMGYTLGQPPLISLFLFTIFALGISIPYLLLSFFPALINKLPRPGAWMETFKVTMSFALFATAAFFMQAFGGQTGVDGMAWLMMALVVIGLAFYFYGRWSLPHLKFGTRFWKGMVLPLAVLGIGGWLAYGSTQYSAPAVAMEGWESWKPGKVEYLTSKKKRIVFVDYTADW